MKLFNVFHIIHREQPDGERRGFNSNTDTSQELRPEIKEMIVGSDGAAAVINA